MILHANAVAENCSACIWARRIDCDDADRLIFFAVVLSELINQRALPCPRRTRQANDARMAGVGKEFLQQLGTASPPVLDCRNGAGQRAGIARAQPINYSCCGKSQTT